MERQKFLEEMETARLAVERRLAEFFPGEGLQEAMRYSLLGGGKRIRPVLAVKFCEAAGGSADEALDFGCGVEMLHTYSLIHDDLPCMDDDDLRRGRPTNHKVFGECIATLAGDALQAAAFQTIACAKGSWRAEGQAVPGLAAGVLARAVGEEGMCGGQYYDTVGDGKPHTEEELIAIHDKKTGALLRAACILGVLASFGHREVDESCFAAAKEYATKLGLAFQIRDDMLDVISTEEALGKPIGSDADNEKTTYVTLLGLEGCAERVRTCTEEAKAALHGCSWGGSTAFLEQLADELATRNN